MRFFIVLFSWFILQTAQAQSWPQKPIRLVVPFAPGGSSSIVARSIAADDAEAVGSTPAEYAAFIKKEQERWSKVVRAAKIKAD